MNAAAWLLAGEPARIALIEGETRVDYATLRAGSIRNAAALLDAGLRPGDACVLALPDGIEWATAFIGMLWAGVRPIAINPRTAPPLIADLMLDAAAAAALLEDETVRVDDLGEHRMHRERYVIPQETVDAIAATRAAGGRVIAVGTTSMRALEAAAQEGPLEAGSGETEIFILPGFRFQVVDALITNFHLPKSTLMMLVSAFAGMHSIRRAYAHAVAQRYRFFSYGDAMFITRRNESENDKNDDAV